MSHENNNNRSPVEEYRALFRKPLPDGHRACVFWDTFDISLYDIKKPCKVYESTKLSLVKFVSSEINEDTKRSLQQFVSFGDFTIMAYAREDLVTNKMVREYKEGGITILPVPDDECARVEHMMADILLWTMDNPSDGPYSLSVCVISKLVKRESFFREILVKFERMNYKVILALPPARFPWSELAFVTLLDDDPKGENMDEPVGPVERFTRFY